MGGPQLRGGWDVCVSEPYNLVPPCLVYSIGYSPLAFHINVIIIIIYLIRQMAAYSKIYNEHKSQ